MPPWWGIVTLMTSPRTEDIEYNTSGWHAALEALMMNDLHPHGFISDSPAARLSRALIAYEWAVVNFPVTVDADGRTSQYLPGPGQARAFVLEYEAHQTR